MAPREMAVSGMTKHTGGLPVLWRALVLHADPELVHLREVEQQELQRVADAAALALILRPRVRQQSARHLPGAPAIVSALHAHPNIVWFLYCCRAARSPAHC